MIEPENLSHDLVAAHFASLNRRRLQLGIGFGHHFNEGLRAHDGVTLQAQNGSQHVEGLRFCHRLFRYQIDSAFDTRINDKGIAGVMSDGAHYRFNISAHEIQRCLIVARFLRACRRQITHRHQQKRGHIQRQNLIPQTGFGSFFIHHLNSSAIKFLFPT